MAARIIETENDNTDVVAVQPLLRIGHAVQRNRAAICTANGPASSVVAQQRHSALPRYGGPYPAVASAWRSVSAPGLGSHRQAVLGS